jgi:hypothetical protein
MIGAGFGLNILEASISFSMHRMELLGDVGLVESRYDPFGDSVSFSA